MSFTENSKHETASASNLNGTQRFGLIKMDDKILDAIVKSVMVIMSIYNATYSYYVKTGAKYGETHEGFMQWIDEIL